MASQGLQPTWVKALAKRPPAVHSRSGDIVRPSNACKRLNWEPGHEQIIWDSATIGAAEPDGERKHPRRSFSSLVQMEGGHKGHQYRKVKADD
jgi:hypothetical protein